MSKFWEKLIRPIMFGLDAERAHEIGLHALKLGIGAGSRTNTFAGLGEIQRFGLKFANPVGIAAGFDKNGVVVNQLAALGFGFVEVGTVTYEPQPGNPKPRMFRMPEDMALINRLGFNNDGAVVVAERLKKLKRNCIVGVNIGKNKAIPNEKAIANYAAAFDAVWPVADYVAVNVSSPNTPNLRELQKAESLDELLGALQDQNRARIAAFRQTADSETAGAGKPLLVKIAPDLSEAEIDAVVDTCLRHKVDGIIATNTTISREGLTTNIREAGGLSGKPLEQRSNQVISQIYRFSNGKLPIIGVGGVFTADDAFEKITAGASLVQAYTGFIYGGPGFASTVNAGLARILQDRGIKSLDEAVGSKLV